MDAAEPNSPHPQAKLRGVSLRVRAWCEARAYRSSLSQWGSGGVGRRQRFCLPVLVSRGGEVPEAAASHSIGCLALYEEVLTPPLWLH